MPWTFPETAMTASPFTATPVRAVVPVDFSDASAAAVRTAAALLRPIAGARLHLLHIHDAAGEGAEIAVKERLVRLTADAGLDRSRAPTVKIAQRHAPDPVDAVVDYADSIGADLIVAGRREVHGWRRLAPTRTADALVHAAHTPVLVLPESAARADAHRLDGRFTVVVGLSLGDGDPALVDAVGAFVARYATAPVRLVLAHAVAPLLPPGGEAGIFVPFDPAVRARAASTVEALAARTRAAGLATDVRVEDGPIAATLLALADEEHADLIALAPTAHSRLARWAFGSVADAVTGASTLPVLLVRSPIAEG